MVWKLFSQNTPGFWICKGSEYTRVLNMPLVLKMPAFRICQGSKYTKALNMPLVLNLPRFWTNQGSEYVRVNRVLNMPKYAWLRLAEYAWKCLNMPTYAWICPNLPEWLLLYISLCNTLSTWTRAYLFQRLHKTRSFSLKENDAVLETQTLIFL